MGFEDIVTDNNSNARALDVALLLRSRRGVGRGNAAARPAVDEDTFVFHHTYIEVGGWYVHGARASDPEAEHPPDIVNVESSDDLDRTVTCSCSPTRW